MSNGNRFADLHCHPHARAFHWMRDTKAEKKHTQRYHPWNVVLSHFGKQDKGKRAFSYSQCDLVKLTNGNVRLVYAALYPFEKGFFKGSDKINRTKLVDILNIGAKIGLNLLFPFKFLPIVRQVINGFSGGENSLRDYFQSLFMRMPIRRINYFTSPEYDYYEELIRERDFLLAKHQKTERNRILITGIKNVYKNVKKLRKKYATSLNATGTYVVCKNFNEVAETLAEDKTAFIMTIEGMHALGTDTDPARVFERIQSIKQWEFPVFFVTFSHHFYNHLSGHAHSIINSATWFMDQQEGMDDQPFTEDGLKAARHLLGLNDQLEEDPALGRRILIDLKHTSATSRQDYYTRIIEPCFTNGLIIPVILSHVGYSDMATLQDHIISYGQESDALSPNGFNPWNINACDEDIQWAAKTNGLIGICLDQRILGGGSKHKDGVKELVFKNLHAMLDVVADMPSPYRENMWNLFCLGTDFEGYIDPINDYADALDFNLLRTDLIHFIKTELMLTPEKYLLQTDQDAVAMADKVCFDNARSFLQRNFH